MNKHKVKICLSCDKEYQPTGNWQKYCTKCSTVIKAERKPIQTKEERKECEHNRYFSHRKERLIQMRVWKHNNPEKVAAQQRKRNFGISQEEYTRLLLSQGGKCAICGKENSGRMWKGKYCRMFVDHDHTTKKVRGLLCQKCNTAIGWLEIIESRGEEKRLIDYLEKYL